MTYDLHDICCGVVCEKIFDYQLFIYRLMDVFGIILHEHIYQKQDVITLFPLKSHLIFGILRYKTCLFASQMLSLNQKNASKTLRILVFFHPIHTCFRL